MSFELSLRLLWGVAGFLLPGAGYALARRWPLPWFAAGVVSTLLILAGVLLGDALSVPISVTTLSLWLVVTGAPGWVQWSRTRPATTARLRPSRTTFAEAWLAAPVLLLVFVAAWRAIAQPLSGVDTVFRWDHLAHLIVENGSLIHYPATTTADFTHYFWADGIAPLVSSAYAWLYLAIGDQAPAWTAPFNLLQTAGLLVLLWHLATHISGPRAGWFALLLAGGTLLLQFSFNLGQETGLTALGTAGMVFYLSRWKESSSESHLLWPAALCASLVACAREYGALAAIVATVWLLTQRAGLRHSFSFALVAALLPLAWHTRVALMTGNPLYAHDLLGLPGNPVFAQWMQHFRTMFALDPLAFSTWREVARLFALTALPAVAGLIAGTFTLRRVASYGLVIALSIAFTLAWWASISSTAGGPFYAMRLLSPVLLLGCAWGGACLTRWVPGSRHLGGVTIGLGLLAIYGSLWAWTFPLRPLQTAVADWPTAGDRFRLDYERDHAPFLRAALAVTSGRVLTDCSSIALYVPNAAPRCSPFWSPDIAWLFENKVPDAAARLRELGFTHILISRTAATTTFLEQNQVLAQLNGSLHPIMGNDLFILFRI